MDLNLEPVGLFDPSATFPLKDDERIKKQCALRFPTDDEWREMNRRIVSMQVPAGPESFRTETQGADEATFDLFQKIRTDEGGDEFDDAEAARMVNFLTRCTVLDSGFANDQFGCRLLLLGTVETVHILKIPTERQIRDYNRQVLDQVTRGRRGRTESRLNVAAGEALYDSCLIAAKGYADGQSVPIQHKFVATQELIEMLDELEIADPLLMATRTPASRNGSKKSRRGSSSTGG